MEKVSQRDLWLGVMQFPTGPQKRLGEFANWVVHQAYRLGDLPFAQYGKG